MPKRGTNTKPARDERRVRLLKSIEGSSLTPWEFAKLMEGRTGREKRNTYDYLKGDRGEPEIEFFAAAVGLLCWPLPPDEFIDQELVVSTYLLTGNHYVPEEEVPEFKTYLEHDHKVDQVWAKKFPASGIDEGDRSIRSIVDELLYWWEPWCTNAFEKRWKSDWPTQLRFERRLAAALAAPLEALEVPQEKLTKSELKHYIRGVCLAIHFLFEALRRGELEDARRAKRQAPSKKNKPTRRATGQRARKGKPKK